MDLTEGTVSSGLKRLDRNATSRTRTGWNQCWLQYLLML